MRLCGVLRLAALTEAFGKDLRKNSSLKEGTVDTGCWCSIHVPQALLLQLPVSAALGLRDLPLVYGRYFAHWPNRWEV